jgi:hypothetical protein
MKKLVFLAAAFTMVLSAQAQCTPDETLIPDAFGVYPDTTQNFVNGEVNVAYSQVLHFKAPSDAGDVDPNFAGQIIESFTVTGVDGMPPGLTYACNISNCQYSGGSTGCATISGTPTQAGTFEITINITAVVLVSILPGVPPTALPVEETFGGYRIIVSEEGSASIEKIESSSLRIYPNPAQSLLTLSNLNSFSGISSVSIINLEGKIMQTTDAAGMENLHLNTAALSAGVYIVEVQHANGIERKRFIKD